MANYELYFSYNLIVKQYPYIGIILIHDSGLLLVLNNEVPFKIVLMIIKWRELECFIII
jgi:hypothetical protein